MISLLLTLLNFYNNFVDQLVNKSYQFKKWETLKDKYHLDNDMYFQFSNAIPQIWKNKFKQNLTKNESNPPVLNHQLIKSGRILTLDKLTIKEIYSVLFHHLKINRLLKVTLEIRFRITPLTGSKFTCYHE